MAQRLLKAHLRVLVVQLEHVSLYFLCRGEKKNRFITVTKK